MKVKVKEEKKGTCAIRLEMFDYTDVYFFQILATWQHTFMHKDIHTPRETGMMTIGKICKIDLSKK